MNWKIKFTHFFSIKFGKRMLYEIERKINSNNATKYVIKIGWNLTNHINFLYRALIHFCILREFFFFAFLSHVTFPEIYLLSSDNSEH